VYNSTIRLFLAQFLAPYLLRFSWCIWRGIILLNYKDSTFCRSPVQLFLDNSEGSFNDCTSKITRILKDLDLNGGKKKGQGRIPQYWLWQHPIGKGWFCVVCGASDRTLYSSPFHSSQHDTPSNPEGLLHFSQCQGP
ncbi:unnamed protein product, partial [Choristocarpus tenellus]